MVFCESRDCSSVFEIVQINVSSVRFVSMCLYFATVLFQLFFYCWYGNEVILKPIMIVPSGCCATNDTSGAPYHRGPMHNRCRRYASAYSPPEGMLTQYRIDRLTMRNLPLCFKFFTWCGFWRPFDVSPSMRFLYDACSATAFLIVCTFTISEFLDIVLNIDNISDFMNNCCILIEMIAICYKAITILVRRQRFLEVLDMLLEASCRVRNDAEQRIQDKFNRRARDSTQNYAIVLMTSTTFLILLAFFKIPKHELPFRAWLPYSISPLSLYWVSFFHQIAALLIGSILSIGYDTFIPGLMIEVCAQLEILRYRFAALGNKEFTDDTNDDREKEVLRVCIHHHCHIIKFASTVENNFHVVIFLQCFVSLVSLCASVFQLLKMNVFSVQFVSMSLYLTVMLFQLFVYCWYGNEVILKSKQINDAIFQTNWIFLKNSTKRDLIIVMIRAQRAIEFTSGYIITLSLESYVAILKASYSVYNVLQ